MVTLHLDPLKPLIGQRAQIIVVAPPAMMKFTVLEFLKRGANPTEIIVSFERHMSCGIGKCGHCKIADTYVCVDSPVFRRERARHLID